LPEGEPLYRRPADWLRAAAEAISNGRPEQTIFVGCDDETEGGHVRVLFLPLRLRRCVDLSQLQAN